MVDVLVNRQYEWAGWISGLGDAAMKFQQENVRGVTSVRVYMLAIFNKWHKVLNRKFGFTISGFNKAIVVRGCDPPPSKSGEHIVSVCWSEFLELLSYEFLNIYDITFADRVFSHLRERTVFQLPAQKLIGEKVAQPFGFWGRLARTVLGVNGCAGPQDQNGSPAPDLLFEIRRDVYHAGNITRQLGAPTECAQGGRLAHTPPRSSRRFFTPTRKNACSQNLKGSL